MTIPSKEYEQLKILFLDNHFIAVDKPAGMLVHRSKLARGESRFVLQTLRDQIDQHVYPVHRLDRATSGVLIFGLTSDAARRLSEQFQNNTMHKIYHAVTRGWLDENGVIDHPVRDRDEGGNPKPAITRYRTIARIELPALVDRYLTSRYTLAEVLPQSGRRHQIRQHFKHISHHLIGDTTYGSGKHNRFFRKQLGIRILLLRALILKFVHPYTGVTHRIRAGKNEQWRTTQELFCRSCSRELITKAQS